MEAFGVGRSSEGLFRMVRKEVDLYIRYLHSNEICSLAASLNSNSLIHLSRASFTAMISLDHAISYVPPTLVCASRGRKKAFATNPRAAVLQSDLPRGDISRAVSFRIPTDPPGLSGRGEASPFEW